MGAINFPGLFTGIDTNQIIAQLMEIQKRTLKLYQQRQATWNDRNDALRTLENKLSTMRTSVRALSDAEKLRAFKTASSDTDILTAEAAYNAYEGNHSVEINRLANAEKWVHTAGLEFVEDYVGAGTFIYSYNNKETSITTTATTTLNDLVGLINNDANNPGVTAGLLYYNNKYHLTLSGNDAGSDYKVIVNPSNTETWQMNDTFKNDSGETATMNTKITDLSQFSGVLEGGEHIHITGTDRYGNAIAQVDLNVTADTKLMHLVSKINSAFDGKAKAVLENGQIILAENNYGASGISLSLEWDPDSATPQSSMTLPDGVDDWAVTGGGTTPANLTNFAQDDFTLTQAANDSRIKVDGYPQTTPVAEVQTLSWSGQAGEGEGEHFHLIYDGQTTAPIAPGADSATIQTALDSLPNVSPGDIIVTGNPLTTSDSSMTFTFTTAAGDVSMLAIDTSALTGLTNPSFAETAKGDDGWIRRSSNTINDVIHGVTLHLHDTTDANSEQITLTRDVQSLKDKLNAMVTAYNAVVFFVQEKTGYNQALKKAGILMGDYVVSTIRSFLTSPLYTRTSGFLEDLDSYLMPGQIGLQLDNDGMLTLDSSAFDKALADDYMGVLALVGADKSGSSDSNVIRFYDASSNYTTAGTYNVEVTVFGGAITVNGAKIKLSTESQYRIASFSGNVITGDDTFDDNGNPLYPENGLQLTADLSHDGTYTAVVRVKQGFAGALNDQLNNMLKAATGSVDIDQQSIKDQLDLLKDRIDQEQDRLKRRQESLVTRFATLEKTLSLIQSQLAALGMTSG
jgi:flagellar hook-associated protein 2